MLNLKIDPIISRKADDQDLLTQVFSRDPERLAYVVRAVNNYEALVAMVETLIGAIRDEDDSFDVKYDARKLLASLE